MTQYKYDELKRIHEIAKGMFADGNLTETELEQFNQLCIMKEPRATYVIADASFDNVWEFQAALNDIHPGQSIDIEYDQESFNNTRLFARDMDGNLIRLNHASYLDGFKMHNDEDKFRIVLDNADYNHIHDKTINIRVLELDDTRGNHAGRNELFIDRYGQRVIAQVTNNPDGFRHYENTYIVPAQPCEIPISDIFHAMKVFLTNEYERHGHEAKFMHRSGGTDGTDENGISHDIEIILYKIPDREITLYFTFLLRNLDNDSKELVKDLVQCYGRMILSNKAADPDWVG